MASDYRINPGEFTTPALAYQGKEFWVDDAGRPVAINDPVGAPTIWGKFEPIDSVYAEDGTRMSNVTARFTTYGENIFVGQQLKISPTGPYMMNFTGVYEIIDITSPALPSLYVECTLKLIKTFGAGEEEPEPDPEPDPEEEGEDEGEGEPGED